VTKIVIFADSNPESTEDDRVGTVIFQQMSYFADEDGIDGLLQYLGEDNPMREAFEAIEDVCHDVDKEPFARWQLSGLDDDFKDLAMRLTKLDPRKRITAQEALSHRWFRDI
jgi:serine/threonine protein kinase